MAPSTARPPSLSRGSLRRQSSTIRTGCANERPSGSARGVPRKRYPYRDLRTPVWVVVAVMAIISTVDTLTIRQVLCIDRLDRAHQRWVGLITQLSDADSIKRIVRSDPTRSSSNEHRRQASVVDRSPALNCERNSCRICSCAGSEGHPPRHRFPRTKNGSLWPKYPGRSRKTEAAI